MRKLLFIGFFMFPLFLFLAEIDAYAVNPAGNGRGSGNHGNGHAYGHYRNRGGNSNSPSGAPEPATNALLAIGALAGVAYVRRKKKLAKQLAEAKNQEVPASA